MVFFDYSNTPTGDWSAQLLELNRISPQGVYVRVFWGEHESLQGFRDFHTKSRLKIEKLCSLTQSLQIPLNIRFGFTEDLRSFPIWTRSLNPQASVPVQIEQEVINPWEFVRVPSFRNDFVRRGFIDFLSEALSLLALYQSPEGSIRSIVFDFGILNADSSPMDSSLIETELSQRYGSIERVNALFQTSFNSFQSLSKPTGLKTLLQKRPWIACWDYKFLKKKSFNIWEDEIKKVFQQNKVPWNCSFSSMGHDQEINCVVIEDTFLEADKESNLFSPLIIQGELDPNVLGAYRVAEMLKIEAAIQSGQIWGLSSWVPSENNRLCVVICSKFIPRKAYSILQKFIEAGGKVVFPFGTPKWDENMENLQWTPGSVTQHSWELDEKTFERIKGCFL